MTVIAHPPRPVDDDTGNAPMIAINDRFGHRPCATEVRHARDLT